MKIKQKYLSISFVILFLLIFLLTYKGISAAKVTINDGLDPIFGQGQSLPTACDNNIKIEPKSSFSNSEDKFTLTSLTLSEINDACSDLIILVSAVDQTGNEIGFTNFYPDGDIGNTPTETKTLSFYFHLKPSGSIYADRTIDPAGIGQWFGIIGTHSDTDQNEIVIDHLDDFGRSPRVDARNFDKFLIEVSNPSSNEIGNIITKNTGACELDFSFNPLNYLVKITSSDWSPCVGKWLTIKVRDARAKIIEINPGYFHKYGDPPGIPVSTPFTAGQIPTPDVCNRSEVGSTSEITFYVSAHNAPFPSTAEFPLRAGQGNSFGLENTIPFSDANPVTRIDRVWTFGLPRDLFRMLNENHNRIEISTALASCASIYNAPGEIFDDYTKA